MDILDTILAGIIGLNVWLGVHSVQDGHPSAGLSFGAAAFLLYLGII